MALSFAAGLPCRPGLPARRLGAGPPNDRADRPGGAGGTRSRPARPPAPGGASASRRSVQSVVARGILGTAAADPNTAQDARRVRRVVPRRARQRVRLVLGWRPPARLLGADDSRETDSGRRRLGEETATLHARLGVHVHDGVAADTSGTGRREDRPPPAGGPDGSADRPAQYGSPC